MPSKYWFGSDFKRHIEAHGKALGSEFTVPTCLGAFSANFDVTVWIPSLDGYEYRRAYLVNESDLPTNGSNYWTLKLYSLSPSGQETALLTWDGSGQGLASKQSMRQPSQGDSNLTLTEGYPIRLKGTKTGAPSALSGLFIEMVLAVR